MTDNRWVLSAWIITLLTLIILLAWSGAGQWQFGLLGTRDFIEYWTAGQLLLQGQDPYDQPALLKLQRDLGWPKDEPLVMWNPPWLLVWMLPLVLLPFGAAALVWLLLSLSVIVICGFVVWRECVSAPVQPRQLAALIIGILLFVPTIIVVALGQVSWLLLLSVVGFVWARRRDRLFLAGMFLALATIKVHVLYLLLVFAAWEVVNQRQWQVLVGALVSLAGAAIVLWILCPPWLMDYLDAFRQVPLQWQTPTVGGVLRVWLSFSQTWLQFAPALLVTIIAVLCLIIKRPGTFAWRRLISPLLLISVPTAAYGWSFDQVVLLIPFVELMAWILTGEPARHLSRLVTLAALTGVMLIMLWQELTWGNDLYVFWVPLALAVIYFWNFERLCPARATNLTTGHGRRHEAA